MREKKARFVQILVGLVLSLGACSCTGSNDCGDVSYYGPQPCSDDAECAEEYGAGWYCDEDATIGEPGCETGWPTCVSGGDTDTDTDTDTDGDTDADAGDDTDSQSDSCDDIGIYGPQPCTSDEECIEEHGAGWYCDEDNVFVVEGCEFEWPVCADGYAWYGPVAIRGDGNDIEDEEEAPQAWYGEG